MAQSKKRNQTPLVSQELALPIDKNLHKYPLSQTMSDYFPLFSFQEFVGFGLGMKTCFCMI